MSVSSLALTGAGIEKTLIALRRDALAAISKSAAVVQMLSGKPSRQIYVRYLKNVYHYATHSAIVIGMAGARSVNRSNKVAQYLLHHATEETGHEAWAFADLRQLGVSEQEILESRPTVNCLAMIGMEYYYAAHANPIALLGWMYTLEALGDDIGHMIAKHVGEGLSLGGEATYFLTGHGDADHDHIKDITSTIVEHVPNENMDELIYVARQAALFYIGLINDSFDASEHQQIGQ